MGDRRAFAAIYDRYSQSLYRFCLSIVGNVEDAQDALQNTMVKALRSLPGEKRQIQLKPWLYRVAHNESIELLRRRRDEARVDPELAVGGGEPSEAAAVRERLRHLIEDLAELPERQRAVLVMRELAGLSFAQIGEALDTSAAVVRQTLYEARLSLRGLEAGREMGCEQAMRQLSEGDGRIIRRRDIQAHLRACVECREFRDAIGQRRRDLAALVPLPAATSAGVLHAVLGGGKAGSALAGTLGVGAAKTAATSTVVKSAATVAVVTAIGVSVADRGGLIDAGISGENGGQPQQAAQPEPKAAPARPATHGSRHSSLRASDAMQRGTQRNVAPAKIGVGAARAQTDPPTPTESTGEASPPSTTVRAKPPELPAASSHGQETAASHGAGHGSSDGHGHGAGGKHGQSGSRSGSESNGKGKGPPSTPRHPSSGAKAQPHPQPGRPPAGNVRPDNSQGVPFKPSQTPTDPGPPENSGAHPSKEAR